jgi:hypothetical protein
MPNHSVVEAMNPFLVCHREERSDVAIHLEFSVDCRSRRASFAMTNMCSLAAPTVKRGAFPPTGRNMTLLMINALQIMFPRRRSGVAPRRSNPAGSPFCWPAERFAYLAMTNGV